MKRIISLMFPLIFAAFPSWNSVFNISAIVLTQSIWFILVGQTLCFIRQQG
ncbi:MAG: hypothetical protein JSS69_17775 [Acidobacteria bacterium]|nr:hypothetical protein [Acidobacteriota bacterium]MBS1867767.1 hypothetical protein [Acidobacteriota bacterium]